MRLFIAVSVSQEVRRVAGVLIQQLLQSQAEVSWVSPEKLHLTLQFLGEVAEKRVPELRELLRESSQGTKPFLMRLKGLGTFPSQGNPRVVWARVTEGEKQLSEMALRLARALKQAGFSLEERAFVPHLTLGRVRSSKNIQELKSQVTQNQDMDLGDTTIERLLLMESKGGKYLKLHEASL